VDALAFEKACDYRFGRLRLVLKNVTMAGIIPKKLFVEAMMYLEGIAPDVPANIMNAIKFNDIDHLMHLLDMHREDQVSLEEALDLLLPEPLRRTLMRMEVPLDLIHEAILHLDSYYPHDLAQDLQKILETKSGQELSDYVVDFFRESTPENPNPRIPEDINWSGEMAYQIRLAYNLAFKTELFNVLRSKGLSNEVLAHLASRIFGNEPTKVALDLYQLMRNTMDASAWPKVIETISIRGMRSRERVMEVYGAFFQPQAPKTALLDDIARVLKAEDKQTRLMELFRPPAQAPAEGEEASA
jgi:hypothetical protein